MNKKYIFYPVALIAFVIGCTKVREGFLSDTIRYKDRVLYAKKGIALTQSDRINADGSTPPITYKMSNLRNIETGAPAPEEFYKEYDVLVFKTGQTFDPQTDTTVALLNQKRELKKMTPMTFNEISGQLSFNRASSNLPVGKYTFDLQANNVWGTKEYSSFADLHVIEPTTDDVFELIYTAATSSTSAEVFTGLNAPQVTAKRISGDGARVILKYVDKNGVAFNPAQGHVVKRGDRPFFETYAKFNPIQYTDTAMICDFEVAPFPLQKYVTPATDWGFLIYYRIPMAFITPDGRTNQNVNPVVSFRLKLEGTYVVTVKMTDVTRTN